MPKKELLIQPQSLLDPDREHFESYQEYYSDNVKSGLDAWFYLQVMNYLSKHKPNELLRTDWLANKEYLYTLYVDKCNELDCLSTPLKDMEHELQEILEKRSDVFVLTEFDPNLES